MIMIRKNFRKDTNDKEKKTVFSMELNTGDFPLSLCQKYGHL